MRQKLHKHTPHTQALQPELTGYTTPVRAHGGARGKNPSQFQAGNVCPKVANPCGFTAVMPKTQKMAGRRRNATICQCRFQRGTWYQKLANPSDCTADSKILRKPFCGSTLHPRQPCEPSTATRRLLLFAKIQASFHACAWCPKLPNPCDFNACGEKM